MSASVDVLAALDLHIAAMAAGRTKVPCASLAFYDESRTKFELARAAIAELIEACAPAASDEGWDADGYARFKAALARCRGESNG